MRRLTCVVLVLLACKVTTAASELLESPPLEESEVEPTPLIPSIQQYTTLHPPVTLIADYLSDQSGSVDEVGRVREEVYPGDSAADNINFEGFLTFDISKLPEEDMVLSGALFYFQCEYNGFPFHNPPFGLGRLYIEANSYRHLDADDYRANQGETIAELSDCPVEPLDVVQFVLASNDDLFQVRLYFEESNGDFFRDDIVILDPVLIIEYIDLKD